MPQNQTQNQKQKAVGEAIKKQKSRARKGELGNMLWLIVGVVVLVVGLGIVAIVYFHVIPAFGSMGTLTGSASVLPNGLSITLTATGGNIVVQGVAVLSGSGSVIGAWGTVPGYSGSSCGTATLYYAGSTSSLTTPFTIQNGQSATIVITGCSGASEATEAVIAYSNGKTLTIPIS